MAQTRFTGPVKSDNGFLGDVTGTASAVDGAITANGYTLATLPAVVVNGIIVVTDANSGDGTVCFGKGTDWIDVKTGLAVA